MALLLPRWRWRLVLDQVASAVECWALQFRYPLPKLGWSGTVTIGCCRCLGRRRWLMLDQEASAVVAGRFGFGTPSS
jgi:hypothetical protein